MFIFQLWDTHGGTLETGFQHQKPTLEFGAALVLTGGRCGRQNAVAGDEQGEGIGGTDSTYCPRGT